MNFRPSRYAALGICAALGAGCGAANNVAKYSALPQAQAQRPEPRGWVLPEAKTAKELLYVADPTSAPSYSGVIDIFAVHGSKYTLVGELKDQYYPDGMATDDAGNLYVTDMGVATEGPAAGNILIFPRGGTIYTHMIVSASWIPFDIAVGKDATLYVANIAKFAQFSPGSVSVYPPSASQPSRVLKFPNFQVYGITLHAHTSTVYVSYATSGSNNGEIAEFVHARGKPTNLGVSYGSPWGLLEDGSGNLLACSGNGTINVYSEATGKLVNQISVPGGALWEAFDQSRSKLFVTDFNDVEIYKYPSGKLIGTIDESVWGGRSNYPTGIAYWPPPS